MTAMESNTPPDRKALDNIVFDALGLTKAERNEVYWVMVALSQSKGASWCRMG